MGCFGGRLGARQAAQHRQLKRFKGLFAGSCNLRRKLHDQFAIARDLTDDGLVLRYRNTEGLNADGLTGEEGTFVICSFWLVSCLALAGEVDRAEELFDRLAGYANDLGLLGEEIDTAAGEQLGNFPQAFSHIGLITAAWQIDQARAR